jgi:hypothetical protein
MRRWRSGRPKARGPRRVNIRPLSDSWWVPRSIALPAGAAQTAQAVSVLHRPHSARRARMACVKPDGLIEHAANYILERQVGEEILTVTESWTPAIDRVLESGRVDRLVLNYVHGFRTEDLARLDDWSIASLQLLDRAAKDLTPICRLKTSLRDLSIEPAPNARLDLERLPRLTQLGSTWSAVSRTISALDLESLFLIGYREHDLAPLRSNARLTELKMKGAWSLQTLDGLPDEAALRTVLVALAPRLRDANGIRAAAGSLTDLMFDACRRIQSIGFVTDCAKLREFGIAHCGRVDSLKPIDACRALRRLWAWGDTRIEDGDLEPLTRLPSLEQVALASRRHYRPSVAEIKAQLDAHQPGANDVP